MCMFLHSMMNTLSKAGKVVACEQCYLIELKEKWKLQQQNLANNFDALEAVGFPQSMCM